MGVFGLSLKLPLSKKSMTSCGGREGDRVSFSIGERKRFCKGVVGGTKHFT